MKRMMSSLPITSLALILVGCAGSSQHKPAPAPAPAPTLPVAAAPTDACTRGKLETDLVFTPLVGPGVEQATGKLKPPPAAGYVVSSTYLALQGEPAAQARFQELVQAIAGELKQQAGLVAFQFSNSMSCGVARTFTIWRDEAAMYAFVAGPAHDAARDGVQDVSRGGSAVAHWAAADLEQATWQYAAERLAAIDFLY